jgi:glucose/arabinose dehydrogenase
MLKIGCVCFAFCAAIVVVSCAEAQQARLSPHETISTRLAGNLVTITYGRPFAKDRKIWGGLVPWGKSWRTGADEATTLVTQAAVKIGDKEIPAGAYTLYTIPSESGTSQLAISKTIGKWGIPVDEKNDLTRVDLKKSEVEKNVDQFTMALETKKGDPSGTLKMTWEKTQFSVAIASAAAGKK